jgi:hypothetical protein
MTTAAYERYYVLFGAMGIHGPIRTNVVAVSALHYTSAFSLAYRYRQAEL